MSSAVGMMSGMQNFLPVQRDQQYLMPPSLAEWLPEDHLAWFVIDAVDQMDLSAFRASYRADGWGRAAHDPAMMVSVLLYGYCVGERSSRRIEQRCVEDVAFRVVAANQRPDHTTIARFRQRHTQALTQLFIEVFNATVYSAPSGPAAGHEDQIRALTKHMFSPESVALRIFSCSLSSAQARKVLRTFVMKNFIAPLAGQLAEPALLRACFVAACLTGLKVQRDVLCLHPLGKAPRAAFLPLFEAVMRACLEAEVAPRPRRRDARAAIVNSG